MGKSAPVQKHVPLGRWGTHTTLAERIKIHPVLYHGAQMFPWAWAHWRGVMWTLVFVVWWSQLGFTVGLLMTGICWGGLTTWLLWKRTRAGGSRISFSDIREEKAHRAVLARKWGPACARFGLTAPGHGGDAPKLRKLSVLPGGSISAEVVTADAVVPEAEFLKHSRDFASVFQCHDVIMTVLDPGRIRVTFHWRDAMGRILPLAELPIAPRGRIAYGRQANGKTASIRMDESLLIGGITGSGKSSVVQALLADLLRQQVPTWLYISDTKGREFREYAKHVGEVNGNVTVKAYTDDEAASEQMVKDVLKNMETRARNTAGRDWTPSAESPYVVFIADEYMDLIESIKAGSKSPLTKYVRKGRAVGYVAWLGTQSGLKSSTGDVRDFIPQRIAMAVRSREATEAILGGESVNNGAKSHMIRSQPGVGYAFDEADVEAQRIRAAYVNDEELALIAAGTPPPAMVGGYREQLGEVVGQHALYRWFDTDGKLLYVGITNDMARRTTEHQDKPWWPEVASSQVEWFPSRKAVLAAEKAAIEAEHPLHNTIHNGRNPRRVLQRKRDVRGAGTLAERRAEREKESAGDAA
jgi:energy-coupling factor transporter ATP-binding protein EcfA2